MVRNRITKYKSIISAFLEKKEAVVVIFLWIIIQAALIIFHGITTDGEAARVIREANNLLNKEGLSATIYYLYLIEIILIVINIKVGLGFWLLVAFQLLLNAVALIKFKHFLEVFTQSKSIAYLGSLLLILCFPYQQYNSYLYTESIFFSVSIIYSCLLLQYKQIGLNESVLIIFFLLLLCITRPSGIFFFAATCVYIFFLFSRSLGIGMKIILFFSLSTITLVLVNFLMGLGGPIDILFPFKKQMIICDVSTNILGAATYQIKTDNSIFGLFNYATRFPSDFLTLGWRRLGAFFGLTRPYYSFFHNSFLILYFYTLYILIIVNLVRNIRRLPLTFIYLLSIIAIFGLSVIASCDEWSNRFFLVLTPFLIISASYLFSKIPSVK